MNLTMTFGIASIGEDEAREVIRCALRSDPRWRSVVESPRGFELLNSPRNPLEMETVLSIAIQRTVRGVDIVLQAHPPPGIGDIIRYYPRLLGRLSNAIIAASDNGDRDPRPIESPIERPKADFSFGWKQLGVGYLVFSVAGTAIAGWSTLAAWLILAAATVITIGFLARSWVRRREAEF